MSLQETRSMHGFPSPRRLGTVEGWTKDSDKICRVNAQNTMVESQLVMQARARWMGDKGMHLISIGVGLAELLERVVIAGKWVDGLCLKGLIKLEINAAELAKGLFHLRQLLLAGQ